MSSKRKSERFFVGSPSTALLKKGTFEGKMFTLPRDEPRLAAI
jgi:hypothetical protein